MPPPRQDDSHDIEHPVCPCQGFYGLGQATFGSNEMNGRYGLRPQPRRFVARVRGK